MPNTNRMQWPYPEFQTNPWYDRFEVLVGQQDASVFAAREDRSLILGGGGTVTWNATTGILSWASAIEIFSPITGFLLLIPAGSVTLSADGRLLYVNLVRAPTESTSVTGLTTAQIPSTDDAWIVGFRRGTRFHFRNGLVMQHGDSGPVLENGVSGGGVAPPPLPLAQIYVGDAFSEPIARSMSGDVTINSLGATTIGATKVTPAKADLTQTWDFTAGPGIVRVPSPVHSDDAVPFGFLRTFEEHYFPVSLDSEVDGVTLSKFLGKFRFDASNYSASRYFRFGAVLAVSAGILTAEVKLYNLSDSEYVTLPSAITTSSTAFVEIEKVLTVGAAAGNLKTSAKIYEVRLYLTGGVLASDKSFLGSAHMRID